MYEIVMLNFNLSCGEGPCRYLGEGNEGANPKELPQPLKVQTPYPKTPLKCRKSWIKTFKQTFILGEFRTRLPLNLHILRCHVDITFHTYMFQTLHCFTHLDKHLLYLSLSLHSLTLLLITIIIINHK